MAPYASWAQVAEVVKGERRLKDLLLPKTETAEAHPFFDQRSAVAARVVDASLTKAGYETPLDSITDVALQNAYIGILVGLLTEGNSNREPWMDLLYRSGLAYLAKIEKGTPVLGVTADSSSTIDLVLFGAESSPVFDDADAYAEVHSVFANLGRRPWGW